MAVLEYNGVLMEIIKTHTYEVAPVTDPSGVDFEGVKITLEVDGWWSDMGLGQKQGGYGLGTGGLFPPPPSAAWGVRGEGVGVSLYNLREHLMMPRKLLRYFIGNTLVLISPQMKASGSLMTMDMRGGPFPLGKPVVEIIGDRTARVRFRIETYVSDCSRYVLSNRWETTESTDNSAFVTRVYNGRASFRADMMTDDGLVPDDFRRWLIIPVEPRMQRHRVQVHMNPQGTECLYTVTDIETNYGTGRNSQVADIICHVTSGSEGAIQDAKQAIMEAGNLFGNAAGIVKAAGSGNLAAAGSGATGMIGKLFNIMVPRTTMAGMCRVVGQSGADRHYLARIAHAFVGDRLNKAGAKPVSMYLSVDWSMHAPPSVDLNVRYLAPLNFNGGLISKDDVFRPLNWGAVISGAPAMTLDYGPEKERTQLPGGNNTRGANVGRLVHQALSTVLCDGPALTPEPGTGTGSGERSLDAKNTDSLTGS